jgi:DNA-binding LytR/AlgR family response regulator
LLKPIRTDRLQKSLEKFNKLITRNINRHLIEQLKNEITLLSGLDKEFKERFLIKTGDKYSYIETKNIAYFFAEGNIVFAVTKENKKSIINYSLQDLEKLVNPNHFFRVTRKYIIHLSSIVRVNKYFNSRLKITLTPATEENILVSKAKVAVFLNWMEGITI